MSHMLDTTSSFVSEAEGVVFEQEEDEEEDGEEDGVDGEAAEESKSSSRMQHQKSLRHSHTATMLVSPSKVMLEAEAEKRSKTRKVRRSSFFSSRRGLKSKSSSS